MDAFWRLFGCKIAAWNLEKSLLMSIFLPWKLLWRHSAQTRTEHLAIIDPSALPMATIPAVSVCVPPVSLCSACDRLLHEEEKGPLKDIATS